MGRSISFAFTLVCLVFVWMVYDNVYSDLGPIQLLAESVACTAKDCTKRHLATQIDRDFYSQRFVFQWGSKAADTVVVTCARSSYVLGERNCRTQ